MLNITTLFRYFDLFKALCVKKQQNIITIDEENQRLQIGKLVLVELFSPHRNPLLSEPFKHQLIAQMTFLDRALVKTFTSSIVTK